MSVVITAKHTVVRTVCDSQHHVVIHVGILRASIHFVDTGDTSQVKNGLTIHGGTLTTTIGFIYLKCTYRCWSRCILLVFFQHGYGHLTNITLGIAASKDCMNGTAMNIYLCFSRAISIVGYAILFRIKWLIGIRCHPLRTILMETHIGSRVRTVCAIDVYRSCTITTTEHLAYLVGFIDNDIGCRRRGCITTTIDLLDTGKVTAVDDHFGIGLCLSFFNSRCRISWLVGCHIPTSINCGYIIGRICLTCRLGMRVIIPKSLKHVYLYFATGRTT